MYEQGTENIVITKSTDKISEKDRVFSFPSSANQIFTPLFLVKC